MKLLSNFLLLLFFIATINSDQFISVILQRCVGTCNKRYCEISVQCRPLNRTSKRVTHDFYLNQGVTLEAPINIEVIAYKKFRTEYRPHMVKLKMELCAQLASMDHPYFRMFGKYWKSTFKGNLLDPCPLSGHRYVVPYISSHSHFPLVPVGEWKVEYILSKKINQTDVILSSWSDFYEIKATSAVEF